VPDEPSSKRAAVARSRLRLDDVVVKPGDTSGQVVAARRLNTRYGFEFVPTRIRQEDIAIASRSR